MLLFICTELKFSPHFTCTPRRSLGTPRTLRSKCLERSSLDFPKASCVLDAIYISSTYVNSTVISLPFLRVKRHLSLPHCLNSKSCDVSTLVNNAYQFLPDCFNPYKDLFNFHTLPLGVEEPGGGYIYTASSSGAFKYARLMSSWRGIRLYRVVRAKNVRMSLQLTTGLETLLYSSKLSISPRQMHRALYLRMLPNESVLIVSTHFN